MVRPRVGDFLYSAEELDVMLEDVGLFKGLGIAGVVFGVLNRDGTVDVHSTRKCVFDHSLTVLLFIDNVRLVEAALPMQGGR